MPPNSIVVAMPKSPDRARIPAIFQKSHQFRVIAFTIYLMNTYNIMEEIKSNY